MSESPTPGADPFLYESDPGFVAYFNAWTRDETDVDSAVLGERKRQVVRIASTIAANGKARFGVLCGAALDLGVTPVELKEVVYQAVAYVGYATVADFLEALNDLLVDRGVELPLPDQSTTTPEDRVERGRQVQCEIFGQEAIDAGRAGAADDAQHLQRYLAGNCFGDVVGRGGLDVATRELVTFTFLATMGGVENQLRAHITGNLNVGNDRATLLAAITALVPAIGYPRALSALAVLDELTRG